MSGLRATLRVIAVASLIFFAVGLFFAAPPFFQQLHILRTWPGTEAVVVRSEVLPVRTASGQMLYDTLLEFAYQVDGRPCVASITSLHQSTSRQRKQKQVERFPPGSHHAIRYNPANPGDIRIEAGHNLHFFAVPVFIAGVAAIFGILGFVFFLLSRARRQ